MLTVYSTRKVAGVLLRLCRFEESISTTGTTTDAAYSLFSLLFHRRRIVAFWAFNKKIVGEEI